MIDPKLHERATEIFGEALERSDESRIAYVERRCGSDLALRRYVERLLVNDKDEPLAPKAAREIRRALHDDVPPEIGGYSITERIGAGGMGVVYRAKQISPPREVAIKFLNESGLGPLGVERFLHESELLARLNHPGIARVFDAGIAKHPADDSCRPYFVMELIEGVSLTKFLAQHQLAVRARVELLTQICDAVEHAHQRGVIHRDIKPANILVDESGRAVLVDFGIGKLIDQDLGLTLAGYHPSSVPLLGTIAYMSPEQLCGKASEIDTRSDVYSLGVVAYEALCGKPPYEIDGLSWSKAIAAIERDEPEPLHNRKRDLAGDLNTIVMKAIEKDASQRYPSVSAMRDDLRRWLDGFPVEARGAGAIYVATKFARRHRIATISVATAVVAIVVALIFTSAALVRAKRDRELAKLEADRAKAMSGFLEATVFGADPEIGGASMSFLDAISYTSHRIPNDLSKYPELQADAHALIGFVLRRHGRYAEAEPHLRQAYRLRMENLGDDHLLTAESMKALGEFTYEFSGRPDEAIMWLERAAEIAQKTDASPQNTCWTWLSLGWARLHANQIDAAKRDILESQKRITEAYNETGEAYAGRAIRALAACALAEGDLITASGLIGDSISRQSSMTGLGQQFPLARAFLTRAEILIALDETTEASSAIVDCENKLIGVVESNHPIYGEIAIEKARIALASGDVEAARLASESADKIFETSLGFNHWRHEEAATIVQLCDSLENPENLAVGPFDRGYEKLQTSLGGSHHRVIWLYRIGAELYRQNGHEERANFMHTILDKRLIRKTDMATSDRD